MQILKWNQKSYKLWTSRQSTFLKLEIFQLLFYLQIISIRLSASTDEKFGASADTSQRYKPLDFKTKRFSITFKSLDDWCCWCGKRDGKKYREKTNWNLLKLNFSKANKLTIYDSYLIYCIIIIYHLLTNSESMAF